MSARGHKYGAVKVVTLDGEKFDSKIEHNHWGKLRLLEKAGKIENLRRQVPYDLTVCGIKIGKIVIDFVFDIPGKGRHCADTKGMITTIARWKGKHFCAEYKLPLHILTHKAWPDDLMEAIGA